MATRPRREKTTADYVFAAIFQLFGLVAINTWPLWLPYTFGVVTPAFGAVVWAANLAASAELLRSLVLAITRPQWLVYLSKMIAGVASFISTSAFLAIFPFDFSRLAGPWLNPVVRVALLLALGVTALGVVVNAARFIFGGPRPTPLGAR